MYNGVCRETRCEVFINEEWVEYAMCGNITLESKAWHKKLNVPLVIIAEGEYPVRFNGKEEGTRTLCFYQRVSK